MSVFVRDWNPQRVKAAIAGRLVDNMERVCEFCVDQARARVPRDTGRLADEIDYDVMAHGDEVTGVIGVRKGPGFYGYFHEVGTSKMAAHPFLRPAVFDNGAQIVRMLGGD